MKKLKHENFTMRNFQIYGTKLSGVNYRILETCGRKPLQIGRKCVFHRENLADCSLVLPRDTHPQILLRNLSQLATKPQKFYSSKVSCYAVVFYLVTLVFHYSH